jgi:hypothetical protein
MLALYLIASHMVGDFVFQTRWQAATKLDDPMSRLRHVLAYGLAFVPVAIVYGDHGFLRYGAAFAFLVWLVFLHFSTDSVRFRSTLGDLLVYAAGTQIEFLREDQYLYSRNLDRITIDGRQGTIDWQRTTPEVLAVKFDWEPNPWPAMPLMIDQTLHLVQLAVLGGLLLS